MKATILFESVRNYFAIMSFFILKDIITVNAVRPYASAVVFILFIAMSLYGDDLLQKARQSP